MNAKQQQRNREPAQQPDSWDLWIRRARKIVFPIVGLGLLIVVPERIAANYWSWSIVGALIFDLPAGWIDKAWRSRDGR